MEVFTFKMEDDQAKELKEYCHKAGKTPSEVIRNFVSSGLRGSPPPAPQPVPQPAPQQPGKLPEFMVKWIGDLVSDRLALKGCLTACLIFLWAPKVLALASCPTAIFCHNGHLAMAATWIWLVSAIVDSLWVGRERKVEVLDRAVKQLWELISRVPDAYRELCRSKSPEAAAAEVLAMITEARGRVGQFGMNDMGISSWNPER